jgi:DMSO reductase family type II enzyme heme b subunit
VNAWFWRADFKNDEAYNQIAKGLGSTVRTEKSPVRARGVWQQGTWTVVFARALATPEQVNEAVQLAAGGTVKIGFAVWEGGSGERAGVKSFSKEWLDLALQA